MSLEKHRHILYTLVLMNLSSTIFTDFFKTNYLFSAAAYSVLGPEPKPDNTFLNCFCICLFLLYIVSAVVSNQKCYVHGFHTYFNSFFFCACFIQQIQHMFYIETILWSIVQHCFTLSLFLGLLIKYGHLKLGLSCISSWKPQPWKSFKSLIEDDLMCISSLLLMGLCEWWPLADVECRYWLPINIYLQIWPM